MLAHELRNPLAPISNAARTLRLGGSDARALRSASDMLERQVGQMSRLVDDLLDLSRITRGRIELRKERIELRPSWIRRSKRFARSRPRHAPRADGDAAAQPVYVDADPARLTQVVGNLLNNACKFTDRADTLADRRAGRRRRR